MPVNYLVEDLLKIHTPHHSQIQWLIKNYFLRSGYDSRTEKQVWPGRRSRIDVWAQKGSYSVGVEVDDCTIRINSIEKLNALKPSLAVFVLKGHKFNWEKTYARFKYLKVKSLIVHLQSKRYKWVYPQNKNFCKINKNTSFYNKTNFSKCQNTSLENSNGAKLQSRFRSEK